MNVTQLQRLDRWVGLPACFLLSGLRLLARTFGRPADKPIRKLLFVKLAEQGSTVLAWPAIRDALEMVGKENLYFIMFEDNRFILDAMEIVPRKNIFTIDHHTLGGILTTTFHALRRLQALDLDAAIDMEFFTRGSAALTFLTGAKRRVGFHPFYNAGPWRGDLMTHRLLYNPHLHTATTFRLMVEALRREPDSLPTMGMESPSANETPPPFAPASHEVEAIRDVLTSRFGTWKKLVLLNPNASDLLPLRRWPAERYAQLAQKLLKQFPELRIAFTGAPAESIEVANLAEQVASDQCISLAGQTTMRQLLVLFTLADVLVTNDSGPAHFAALTPVHVVTLFGPETPALYSSLSLRNKALSAEIVCSPCVNAFNNRQSPCRNNVCMQSISVEQVFAEVCCALKG